MRDEGQKKGEIAGMEIILMGESQVELSTTGRYKCIQIAW